MTRFQRILVAQDFSDCSEHALEAALRLAEASGASVDIAYVQVLHEDPFSPSVAADQAGRIREALHRKMEESESVPTTLDVELVALRDISAAHALVKYADEHDCDLIVMGTHGRRGLRRLMIGSVAEEVVRTAHCPVVTVHQADDLRLMSPGPNAQILVPLDFSRASLGVLPVARRLAADTGSALRLLHVIEETAHPAFYNAGVFSVYDLQPGIEEKALEHLREAYGRSAGPLVPVVFDVVRGNAASEIVSAARLHGCGSIAMATHGLSGLAHVFLGSVAERVVRLAHCPVLTVRADAHRRAAETRRAHHAEEV